MDTFLAMSVRTGDRRLHATRPALHSIADDILSE
jgi:hypothetical protein